MFSWIIQTLGFKMLAQLRSGTEDDNMDVGNNLTENK